MINIFIVWIFQIKIMLCFHLLKDKFLCKIRCHQECWVLMVPSPSAVLCHVRLKLALCFIKRSLLKCHKHILCDICRCIEILFNLIIKLYLRTLFVVTLFKTVLFFLSGYCFIISILINDWPFTFWILFIKFLCSMWLIGSKEVENVKGLQTESTWTICWGKSKR